MSNFIKVPILQCNRCEYKWMRRSDFCKEKKKWIPFIPKGCAKCRSTRWNEEKILEYEHWTKKKKTGND